MKAILTILVTLGVILLSGLLFIYSGIYNVAASQPHNPFVRWFFTTLKERSVTSHASSGERVEPAQDLAAGHRGFAAMCVMCHGSPTQSRWEPARYLNPVPPALSHEAGEWSLAELTWIVEHGIKMTGMPAFGPTHGREEIVQIATFVDTLPSFTSEGYAELINQLTSQPPDTSEADTHRGHEHSHP
jgi:mono/diheme cytochrome c family protein